MPAKSVTALHFVLIGPVQDNDVHLTLVFVLLSEILAVFDAGPSPEA